MAGYLHPVPESFTKSLSAKFGFEGAESRPIIRMFLIAVEGKKKPQQQNQNTHPTRPQASQGFGTRCSYVYVGQRQREEKRRCP